MADMGKYQGKVVVITGASSGFGRGTALELAERGALVVLAARSAETIKDPARECEAAGGQALSVPTEVCDRSAVESPTRQAIARFGHIDAWINNPGVAARSLSTTTSRSSGRTYSARSTGAASP